MFKGFKKKFSNKGTKDGKKEGSKSLKEGKTNSNSETENNPEKEESSNGQHVEADNPFARPIAKFSETPREDQQALLIEKMRLCQLCFTWYDDDTTEETNNKRIKKEQLLELVEFIGQKQKMAFSDQVLQELIHMVSANLFRALPPKSKNPELEDEEAFFMEPSWPHLQIVYEFFLRFIVSSNLEVKGLKKYITSRFVIQILELFDSEDRRERDYLKTILHRIYAKFMPLRAFIRKAINFTFWNQIELNCEHNGIAELLEILGSIINGFALPLKQEHKNFLFKVLIPMHKTTAVTNFHTQLSYCVTQFVDKDHTLAVAVISGFLKFWPKTDSSKELLFLQEFEELLELTPDTEFQLIIKPVCERLAQCVGSSHFQIAERTLFFWQNEYIYRLCSENREKVLPILYPVLYGNSQYHWNPMVNKLTANVLGVFQGLDAALVDECHIVYEQQQAEKQAKAAQKADFWADLCAKEAETKLES